MSQTSIIYKKHPFHPGGRVARMIQDVLFPNHGPYKGITSINIQRKNHNYREYSYTMTYVSQHIKSNKQVINSSHVVFDARLLSLIQIIFDKFAHCIKY